MKIAILDDYSNVALDCADFTGLDVTVFHDTLAEGEVLIERLAPFDILCLMRERTPMPAHLIAQLPRLKLIVTTGMRNLSIDMAAASAAGITVCGTRSRGPETAELAMTLILALSRGLVPQAAGMAAGGWQTGLGRDLNGLTLGVIGLGRLGAQVAALGAAFGMEVCAWSENLTPARCEEVGVRHAGSLRGLLEQSDVASVHLVLSDRSRGLIGAEALSAMKPDACLINTSRGPIVDWRAVLAALRAGRLGGYATDVFDQEPLPADHPLRDRALIDQGRLLLTPHIGYVTRATYERFYSETVEAVRGYLSGAPVRVLAAPE